MDRYDGRLGMLTVLVDGVLHRVGQVITPNREELANSLCRQLGYKSGVVIGGPWLRLSDGMYSYLQSWCIADVKDTRMFQSGRDETMGDGCGICEKYAHLSFTMSQCISQVKYSWSNSGFTLQ